MKKINLDNKQITCKICSKLLTNYNVARDEKGVIRKDSFGYFWCKNCADRFDQIDWEEVLNKYRDNWE